MRDWECENMWKGFSIAICLKYTSVQCQSICFWCSLPVSVSLCCILYSMSVSLCCVLSYNTSVLYLCAVLGILHMSVTAEFHCCALLHYPLVWWWSPWQAVGSGQTILECGSRCSWWWRRQCFSQYAPTPHPQTPPHPFDPPSPPYPFWPRVFKVQRLKFDDSGAVRCVDNNQEQKTQRHHIP